LNIIFSFLLILKKDESNQGSIAIAALGKTSNTGRPSLEKDANSKILPGSKVTPDNYTVVFSSLM
jgi:hypothetical protein